MEEDNAKLLVFVLQGFGGEFAVFLNQYFHALFRRPQALLARPRQLDSALEGFHGLFQRLFAGLHFPHDIFQFRERGFKVGRGAGKDRRKMESGEQTLEEAMKSFQRGIELTRACQQGCSGRTWKS